MMLFSIGHLQPIGKCGIKISLTKKKRLRKLRVISIKICNIIHNKTTYYEMLNNPSREIYHFSTWKACILQRCRLYAHKAIQVKISEDFMELVKLILKCVCIPRTYK